ncbi:hypothetical protein [Streptomyces sp. NRRL F-5053]|uniref:hypothetical protein n=1 Tax=Streptomyces sp. NRRL F-5053 TaxID=1463854 RepID=UPI0004C86E1A|nr:hypothetical protein [Streptomyces sp. NRRL F-5053]
MNDGQRAEQSERYGSRFARLFGYVTPDDHSRWLQQREQNRPNVSSAKRALKAGADSMLDFGTMNMQATLNAAHRVAAQRQFDESHNKIIHWSRDPQTRSITETVDYEPKDAREEIEPDYEL